MAERLLSGIQPTGKLHIGNYFGAARQFVEMQDTYDVHVMAADLHALSQVHDREQMKSMIRDLVVTYLAIGLDPKKVVLFQQSAVSAHAELAVILGGIASFGQLERSHAFKDAVANGKEVNLGLFSYPVLMAADILLYKPKVVPVGKDQQQNLEITNDLAQRFNHLFGHTFDLPEAMILPDVAVVTGLDGRKMSKSYGNTIELFEDSASLSKKVMRITTDSRGPAEAKDPATDNIFALHKLVATEAELAELHQAYTSGAISYKESKDLLVTRLEALIAPLREARAAIEAKKGYIEDVLADGAKRASVVANATLEEVKQRIGVA